MNRKKGILDFFTARLQRKLMLLVLILVSPVMGGMSAYWVTEQRDTAATTLTLRADRMAYLLSQTLAPPLWNLDENVLRAQLTAVMADPDLFSIGVYEKDSATPLVSQQRAGVAVEGIAREALILYVRDQDVMTLGTVKLLYTREYIYQEIARTQYIIFAFILALGALLAFGMYILIRQLVEKPIHQMSVMMTEVAEGDFSARVSLRSRDEIGQLAHSLNWMTEALQTSYTDLQNLNQTLEARVAARVHRLATIATLSEELNAILDIEVLLPHIVEIICERFDLYYAGLFLVDETGQWAVLRAGSGEAGQSMLAAGHRLQIGGQSMIGAAISTERARIALDVGDEAVRFNNPYLPDTHSEMALPLVSRGGVIGALTIQSMQHNAFSVEDITELQTVANQVAVALDNARLFAESQAALEQSRRAYGDIAQQAWQELLRSQQGGGYRYEKSQIARAEGAWRPEMLQVLRSGQPVVHHQAEATLAVPLKVRDQVIGVLNLRRTAPDKVWTAGEHALVEALAEQVGVALESARLYQDTQRRAARERLLREVTARVRTSSDPETVLSTLLREVGNVLGRPTFVRLGSAEQLAQATPEDETGTPARAASPTKGGQ